MPSHSHIAALVVLGGLAACAEDPSYDLAWTIEDEGRPSVARCAESGLFQVRTRTYVEAGTYIEERTYPCAAAALEDEDGAVTGPTLAPGRYAIELRGIDRASTTWDDPMGSDFGQAVHHGCAPDDPDDPDDPPAECRPNERVCDCVRLDIDAEGRGTLVDDAGEAEPGLRPTLAFTIDPPLECEDGIDNDVDGRVDEGDPSCVAAFADGTEGLPVGVTELQLDISMLAHAPLENCISSVGGMQLSVQTDDGPQLLLEESCRLDAPYFVSVLLPPGPAEFSVVGLVDPCDEQACLEDPYCLGRSPECYPAECSFFHQYCDAFDLDRDLCALGFPEAPPECFVPADQPATVTKTFSTEIQPAGGSARASIDFDPSDVLEPIEGRMRFAFSYRNSLGTVQGETIEDRLPVPARSSCNPVLENGQLSITGLRLTMLNAHGGPLDQPVRLADGTVLDGSTVLPCSTNIIDTEIVDWTHGYQLMVEALSAEEEVCFRREGIPMRPEEASTFELPRVYLDDGSAPVSCGDCASDGDCNTESFGEAICLPAGTSEGTCQYPCLDDTDCRSEELGDLGFTCDNDDGSLDLGYCRLSG